MDWFAIIFTLLVITILTFPFTILRLGVYCLCFYLRRKFCIKLSVGKCGFTSFRNLNIELPIPDQSKSRNHEKDTSPDCTSEERQTISLSVESVRLSSLYTDNSCTSILSICITNLTINQPIGSKASPPLRVRSLELPIDKIRSDFFRHYKENFKISVADLILTKENFSYKIEKLNVIRSVETQKGFQVDFDRVIFSDLSIPEMQPVSEMPEELTKQRILFIEQLQVIYLNTHNKILQFTINGDCFLQFNLEVYINFLDLIQEIKSLIASFRKPKQQEPQHENSGSEQAKPKTGQALNVKVELNGRLSIGVMVSEDQVVCVDTKSLDVNASFPGPKTVHTKKISLHFDDHTILNCTKASLSHYPSPGISCILDRKQNSCNTRLSDEANSLLCVDMETVNLMFPHNYNFADTFNEKFMGFVKWLKKFHLNPNKIKNPNPPIDFDMSFRIKKFIFEMEDDPFETKLRKNYMLLEDEYHEQIKRDQTLQDKINELKRTNLMLPSSTIEELNRKLVTKNSEIYIQRSKQLYSSEARRVPLFSVIVEEADLKILADSSFHKHEEIKSMIRSLNPESNMGDDVQFSTLFCRVVSANLKSAEFLLRDFPMSMLAMRDFTIKGTILGAEQVAMPRARRKCQVYLGRNLEPATIERSMTPLKIFHNLQIRCSTANYTHGPCWEPILQQVSLAFDDIVSASSDPSPSLSWWDKMRFICHGQAKLNCNQLSVVLHASHDPYNQTEMIELTLMRAVIDLTTGKFKVKGDFDALLHTASKYDECRFIHIPNLDVTALLSWNCLGNPYDHFSIMPCAPDKVPDYSSHHSHDSYRSFRSQSLNLNLNIETQFTSPTSSMNPENMPSMLLFGSTIRWLENQKFIFVGPSKLTRRGVLFNNTKPKKPSLSRIFKDIQTTILINRFQIFYWSSVSKRHGIQILGGELTHSSEHTLKLVTNATDGLKHRPQADWQIAYMHSSLSNVDIWLYNLGFEDLDEFNELNTSANCKNRQYFLSFNRVVYNKEAQVNKDEADEYHLAESDGVDSMNNDIQSSKGDDTTPNHRLVVHDLKAAWTRENRDVVIGIFDAFMNSQQLKRNLSTEALKPIRIEQTPSATQQLTHQQSISSNSPPHRHQRHPSTTSLIILNPVSSVSKNRAVSMLQKLIADSENNPNVYTEESHPGVASETHLYGVEACQMDDVVYINCLIELVNSQVVLCGTETPGYVIVSASQTEIRQGIHLPVWKNRTLLSKTTWTGSLQGMQYYATVDGNSQDNTKTIFTNEDEIQWLDPDNIDSKSVIIDFPDMVGSGQSVGGVVSTIVGKLAHSDSGYDGPTPVQLQRIISRCNCLFYYATHTAGVPEKLQHLIPPLPDDDMFIEPWDKEVGVDSFTLTHQDLDISTNSQQYSMIVDLINHLLLFVEPHKKTAFEKLERMRFRFQLSSDEDQREPISQLQDQVRKYVAYLKRLERERYLVYRASLDDSMMQDQTPSTANYRTSLNALSSEIMNVKEQLNSASEELAMMISCYKEVQLGAHKAQKQQQAASQQGTGAFFANVIRRNEICFQNARWRVTDSDGQLGLADIIVKNFLYSKIVKSDDSVEHTIELGHLCVENLIPNQAYKDVLHPTELQANIPLDRQRALRIYCRELAPVGGIPVKEHLEVNVVPFTIKVTKVFFQKMVKFFFPEKESAKEEKAKHRSGLDLSGEHQISMFGGKKKNKDKNSLLSSEYLSVAGSIGGLSSTGGSGSSGKGSSGMTNVPSPSLRGAEDTLSTVSTATMNSTTTVSSLNSNQRRGEEIEKMRERASKNHTFVYVKIPGIPIKVSYKQGKKQKSVIDVKNMSLTLPTYEYHNLTWTWLDLLMAVKNDSKHTVIKQALKQKMPTFRPSSIWSKATNNDQHSPTSTEASSATSNNNTSNKEKNPIPVTDEEKARLLLGQYANCKSS